MEALAWHRPMNRLKLFFQNINAFAKWAGTLINNFGSGIIFAIIAIATVRGMFMAQQLHSPEQVKRLIGLSDEKAKDLEVVLSFFLRNYDADRAFVWFYARGERGEPISVFKKEYQVSLPGMKKIEGKYDITIGVGTDRYQKHQVSSCTFYDAEKLPPSDLLVQAWKKDTRYHVSCPFQVIKNDQTLFGAFAIEGMKDFSPRLTDIENELLKAGSYDIVKALSPN